MAASARTKELLAKFGRRLTANPFSIEGIPSEEEVRLTNDIWKAITESEKKSICDKIKADYIKQYGVKDLPDPTPYAMRLAYRYLEVMNKELTSSG